ncbi:hypothetical protein [Pontimicrobium sp. SW4]|uniref:Outer membrane protein beta-barrel domain-containing protein n=1 Tax=Pontimicrobium sp. SW4 TaxID=3153519 RepID=A0AAU7BXL3_9FLAO
MNQIKITLLLLLVGFMSLYTNAQEPEDYIEFNDRKNTVHGVYLGLGTYYGKIDNKDSYFANFKIAYVANQQFEVGFVATGLYADINEQGLSTNVNDLAGAYGGLHLEPIIFGKSKFNISFPVLIGGGAIVLLEDDFDSYVYDDDWEAIFVVEPGISLLYNINRYIQLEAGFKHRFSSRVNLANSSLSRINGFSAGIGVKVGVFNMGRNRYKKKG